MVGVGKGNSKIQMVWFAPPSQFSVQYLYKDASHIQQLHVPIWHTNRWCLNMANAGER